MRFDGKQRAVKENLDCRAHGLHCERSRFFSASVGRCAFEGERWFSDGVGGCAFFALTLDRPGQPFELIIGVSRSDVGTADGLLASYYVWIWNGERTGRRCGCCSFCYVPYGQVIIITGRDEIVITGPLFHAAHTHIGKYIVAVHGCILAAINSILIMLIHAMQAEFCARISSLILIAVFFLFGAETDDIYDMDYYAVLWCILLPWSFE